MRRYSSYTILACQQIPLIYAVFGVSGASVFLLSSAQFWPGCSTVAVNTPVHGRRPLIIPFFLPVTLHKHYVARYSPWILAELGPDDRLRPRVGASCHILLLPGLGVAG